MAKWSRQSSTGFGLLISEPPCNLSARPEVEFAQDMLDVHFDRPLGDHQPLANVMVAQPVLLLTWQSLARGR